MMFLIAKIVRGRRLLHELEQEEKEEEEALASSRRAQGLPSGRLRASGSGPSQEQNDEPTTSKTNDLPVHRSQTTRRNEFSSKSLRHRSPSIWRSGSSRRKSTAIDEMLLFHEERKTVRQKTDGSFGESEELDRNGMRRTSSMPSVCEPVIPSSSGPSLRHYDYDGKLNKLQKKALRFTWHRLQTRNGGKRVEQVFEEVFDRLVRQVPQVREMFTTRMFLCAMNRHETASLRDHSRAIVRMIDVVIKNLEVERLKRTDTASEMDPRLIGRSHGSLRPYGMTGNYWEKLGETIVDVVLAQEAVRDLPGAGQAWVILAACLVDQLRAGFDETRFTQNQGILNKQGTVLHHATQHLNRDMSIDENHIEECPMAMSSHSPPSPPPILDEGCRRQSRPRTEEASA